MQRGENDAISRENNFRVSFSPSNPITTSKYGPIFAVDTFDDVFPCVFVLVWKHSTD